ncbi:MAG: 4Fe-4S binding protein [Thermodesulfobacteriota bacterium]
MKHYTGYFYCRTRGLEKKLLNESICPAPSTPFPSLNREDCEVLLASGFSDLHPDSPFFLSATLQLNGDRGNHEHKVLATIAEAELCRLTSSGFRSYRIEADPRVTVVASRVSELETFIDRYGGVLEIIPLLVGTGHRGMESATEVEVTAQADGCLLQYQVRAPVDFNHCSYCGLCGSLCPEGAVSEGLIIDFERCTLCRDCVSGCPHNAVDLHGVEYRELTTPALMVLDGCKVELPKRQDRIYTSSRLDDLFASVYERQVDEVIDCDQSLCQFSAARQTGCRICYELCRHDAIKLESTGVVVDQLSCVECGSCVSGCPGGALQYRRCDDRTLIEYFRSFQLRPNTSVVIGDAKSLHRYWWYGNSENYEETFFFEYPNPAALSSMHLLFLYAMGARRLLILAENGNGPDLRLANFVIQGLFGVQEPIELINWGQLDDRLSREAPASPLKQFYHDFSFGSRRHKLVALLDFLRQQSGAAPLFLDDSVGGGDFGTISCDEELCSHCGACVGECQSDALVIDDNAFLLQHHPSLCVQCGACADLCPEKALSTICGVGIDDGFFSEKILARAEPLNCKGCGKVFSTRKALEKVTAILTAKNFLEKEDDMLHFCDECRVINLFEQEQQ